MRKISIFCVLTLIPAFSVNALTREERNELFSRVEILCQDASNIGEVFSYEGDLEAGAVLRLVNGNLSGTVTRTSWNNINQLHGDYGNDPTYCRQEMIKIIFPLFEGNTHNQNKLSVNADGSGAVSSVATPTGAFAVYAGPKGASAGSATATRTETSHSD